MLFPSALVVLIVGTLRGREFAFRLPDLLKYVLDICLQCLLKGAELLLEGGLEALGPGEGFLGVSVFRALAFGGFGALG